MKAALETAIKLQPRHADAHIALGAFHAEVIDKVGALLGRTQGASRDQGLQMYKTALKLNPVSAIAMVEYANGLVMLEGDKKMKEAEKLYADAAACDRPTRWSASTSRWPRPNSKTDQPLRPSTARAAHAHQHREQRHRPERGGERAPRASAPISSGPTMKPR